jgi:hypothetical protein
MLPPVIGVALANSIGSASEAAVATPFRMRVVSRQCRSALADAATMAATLATAPAQCVLARVAATVVGLHVGCVGNRQWTF